MTSFNFSLASSLEESLKNDAICQEHSILEIFQELCLSYEVTVQKALDVIEQNVLIPSWKDALISADLESNFSCRLFL